MENEKILFSHLKKYIFLTHIYFFPGGTIVGLSVTTGIGYYWDEAGKGKLIDGCSCITDIFHSHPSEDESIKECEGET